MTRVLRRAAPLALFLMVLAAAAAQANLWDSDSTVVPIPPPPDWTPDSIAAPPADSVRAAAPPPAVRDTSAVARAQALVDSLAIDAAQRAPVHTMDSTLVVAQFDPWFRDLVGPDAKVFWETNDCGESTGSPADSAIQIPLCVEARAEGGFGTAYVLLVLGSRYGVVDTYPPRIFYWQVNEEYSERRHRLSDFANAIQRARAAR